MYVVGLRIVNKHHHMTSKHIATMCILSKWLVRIRRSAQDQIMPVSSHAEPCLLSDTFRPILA